jgi:RES domain-containing protein
MQDMNAMPFDTVDGLFYRIVPAHRAEQALAPAVTAEGRFHHSAQPTLYVSPRPDWACHAIAPYVQDGDPPRVICELHLTGSRILDLRNPTHCAAFGIDPALAAIPWLSQRARGLPASTWEVSDRARTARVDGMIYTARSEPSRWHLALFSWPGAQLTGRLLPYPP